MHVQGFNTTGELEECECHGVQSYISCQWQRLKHTISKLPVLTHLLDQHEHTPDGNSSIPSLRAMELPGKLPRNDTGKTPQPEQSWKSDASKVKTQRNDPGGGREMFPTVDNKFQQAGGPDELGQGLAESDDGTGDSHSHNIEKRWALTFVANTVCCAGTDLVASALGCAIYDGTCKCPSINLIMLSQCVPTVTEAPVTNSISSTFLANDACCQGTDPIAAGLGCVYI
ncbi:hypothetical protein EGW08_018707, partial [Elysia chlorotica]